MNKPEHTPGPWRIQDEGDHAKHYVPGRYFIMRTKADPTVAQVREMKDARLIAAAPRMLEALRDYEEAIMQEFQGEPRLMFLLEKTRAILRELEG